MVVDLKLLTCPSCGFTGPIYLDWCFWMGVNETICQPCSRNFRTVQLQTGKDPAGRSIVVKH